MSSPSRRWVKIWHENLTDPDFQNLTLEQQARYYNLLVYISAHGEGGRIVFPLPNRYLLILLQCHDECHAWNCISALQSVGVVAEKSHAQISVTIKNWSKYQIDSTACDRKRKQRKRDNVTPKEKEKEKESKEESKEESKDSIAVPVAKTRNRKQPASTDEEFLAALRSNSAYRGVDIDRELARMDAWLLTPKSRGRQKTRQFIVNWLNKIDVPIQRTAVTPADISLPHLGEDGRRYRDLWHELDVRKEAGHAGV